jgi:hypothetical protein
MMYYNLPLSMKPKDITYRCQYEELEQIDKEILLNAARQIDDKIYPVDFSLRSTMRCLKVFHVLILIK